MIKKIIEKIRNTPSIILLFILLLSYFVFHFIEGNRGLISYFEVTSELKEKKSDLKKLELEATTLENKVNLLRDGNIDPDMLEERAKSQLKIYAKDEFIIVNNEI